MTIIFISPDLSRATYARRLAGSGLPLRRDCCTLKRRLAVGTPACDLLLHPSVSVCYWITSMSVVFLRFQRSLYISRTSALPLRRDAACQRELPHGCLATLEIGRTTESLAFPQPNWPTSQKELRQTPAVSLKKSRRSQHAPRHWARQKTQKPQNSRVLGLLVGDVQLTAVGSHQERTSAAQWTAIATATQRRMPETGGCIWHQLWDAARDRTGEFAAISSGCGVHMGSWGKR